MAEERENKILEERRNRTIWIRKNGRGEKDREPKKDVAAILLTKKRNKGAGKEGVRWCGSKGQLKKTNLLSLLHILQIFIKIALMKIKVCVTTMKFKGFVNNL